MREILRGIRATFMLNMIGWLRENFCVLERTARGTTPASVILGMAWHRDIAMYNSAFAHQSLITAKCEY